MDVAVSPLRTLRTLREAPFAPVSRTRPRDSADGATALGKSLREPEIPGSRESGTGFSVSRELGFSDSRAGFSGTRILVPPRPARSTPPGSLRSPAPSRRGPGRTPRVREQSHRPVAPAAPPLRARTAQRTPPSEKGGRREAPGGVLRAPHAPRPARRMASQTLPPSPAALCRASGEATSRRSGRLCVPSVFHPLRRHPPPRPARSTPPGSLRSPAPSRRGPFPRRRTARNNKPRSVGGGIQLIGVVDPLAPPAPLARFSKIRSHRTTRNNTEVP